MNDSISKLKQIPLKQSVLRTVLWVAHQSLTAFGFRWEVQRHGDIKLGLWRKTYRKKTLHKPIPSRFVLIPGFGDTPLSWLSVITLLEPVLRTQFDEVVLIDFPGYNGRLYSEGLFPSVDALLDSLFDVLDSLKPHTVMGHSLGGFLTTHYAAACSSGKRPTGTDKKQDYRGLASAIVIDASGFFESEIDRNEWSEKIDRLLKEGEKFWRPFIFSKEPVWFKLMGSYFLEFLSRAEIEGFIRSSKPEHELRAILPEIKTEMTLIWGEHDTLLPASLVPGWLKHLTQTHGPTQAVIIRDSGHSPQVEKSAAIAAVIGQVLLKKKPHSVGNRWYKVLEA
jgi:pimeloyl-ACP methyl ester carboxylesterase